MTSPEVWGYIGSTGYMTGAQPAPDGLRYNPLLSLDSDFNLALLPQKYLYLFVESDFWVQRSGVGASGVNPRQFDMYSGLAWNYWDSLELRADAFSLNNVNRGTSLGTPAGYGDGIELENRYYFWVDDPYDTGRLSFISVGGAPSKSWLVGNDGSHFELGGFAELRVTHDLPLPFRSYIYGDLRLTGQKPASPRLLDTDIGVAVRPLAEWQPLEFRLGYRRTDDFTAGPPSNYAYGSVRLNFGIGAAGAPAEGGGGLFPGLTMPEVWGVAGLPMYPFGSRMAPNGVSFRPIFSADSDFNIGLLPHKEVYLFWNGTFWAQHSGVGITNSGQGVFDFSRREIDSELGAAWGYYPSLEARASASMQSNLNRGTSLATDNGGTAAFEVENRYYLPTTQPYDIGRLNFVGLGYVPAGTMIGEDGSRFHPGLSVHAYLTADLPIPWVTSYVYGDLRATAHGAIDPRLLDADFGLAVRPLPAWQNLEVRLGSTVGDDFRADRVRDTVYAAVRIGFDPAGFGGFSRDR